MIMRDTVRRDFLKQLALAGSGLTLAGLSSCIESPNTGDKKIPNSGKWKKVLELDQHRSVVDGSNEQLLEAIRNGADLRVYTEFRHNEHIDLSSDNDELIREVADFRVTYVLDDRWVAGIINLRQPIELPIGFGPRPSMSFFMYNQNGDQAIARPYLDGQPITGSKGNSPLEDYTTMEKYHQRDAWDSGTNGPSSNFVYDFDTYKFWICNDWEEVYSNDMEGNVLSGSLDALTDAFSQGREVKVGVTGLCADIVPNNERILNHEVFIHCGSCYYYTRSKQFCAASHPGVRVQPAIPLKYESDNWDFGWFMFRSDGHVARWLVDPYNLKFNRDYTRHQMRWFVR